MSYLKRIYDAIQQRMAVRGHKQPAMDNSVYLERALLWLKNSRLESGAFASEYSMLWERYFPASPESEAGWLSTLIHLGNKYPHLSKKIFIDDPVPRVAERVISYQRPDGSFPVSFEDLANQPPGIFTTGRCLDALHDYYLKYGGKEVLEKIFNSAFWMLTMLDDSGQWKHYTFNLQHANTMTAAALIRLGRLVNENKFIEAGKRKIEYAISRQNANGTFGSGTRNNNNHFTEVTGFALLGIIKAAAELNNESYAAAAAKGYRALLALMTADGYLPGEIDEDVHSMVNYCCLSGNCILSSAAFRIYKITGDDTFLTSGKKLLHFVKDKQMESKFRYLDGGISGSFPISGQFNTYEIHSSAVSCFAGALMEEEEVK